MERVNLILRMPEELHEQLVEEAKDVGVSLNTFIVSRLSGQNPNTPELTPAQVTRAMDKLTELPEVLKGPFPTRDDVPRCSKCGFLMGPAWRGKRTCSNKTCRHEQKVG